MDLQSGIYLPFFLLSMPIILAILDMMGISKSTSAMTSGDRDSLDTRRNVNFDSNVPRATI